MVTIVQVWGKYMGIGLNSLLYLGSHYNTGPYIHFPHFGNSNLGKLPYDYSVLGPLGQAGYGGHSEASSRGEAPLRGPAEPSVLGFRV